MIAAFRFFWEGLAILPTAALIVAARCYQFFLSPLLGKNCRFQPTCSVYFVESVRKHGALLGAYRGVRRLLRCHPFHPGGYDPP